MPYHVDENPDKLQIHISSHMLNSLAYCLPRTVGLNTTINHDVVPESFPIQLNTNGMDILFPGISKVFGSNKNVDVLVNITSIGEIVINNTLLDSDLNITLDFLVETNNTIDSSELAVSL